MSKEYFGRRVKEDEVSFNMKKFYEAVDRLAKKWGTTRERILLVICTSARKNGIKAVSAEQ